VLQTAPGAAPGVSNDISDADAEAVGLVDGTEDVAETDGADLHVEGEVVALDPSHAPTDIAKVRTARA